MSTKATPFLKLQRWGIFSLCLLAAACKHAPPVPGEDSAQSASSATLPTLAFKDDTADLLLTWVDSSGDFHVAQKPAEVPEEGRSQVRVVVTTSEAGTGDTVYVADLRQKDAGGSYTTTTLSRKQWNDLGADRRKVRLEALAPKAESSAEKPTANAEEDGTPAQPGDYSKVRVIIYGASWCKPCHDAEKFLRGLGANVTKKDIEESRAAQAEMQQKLEKAGRGGSSIPVIDVAGTLFVGFSEDALRRAVVAAAAKH